MDSIEASQRGPPSLADRRNMEVPHSSRQSTSGGKHKPVGSHLHNYKEEFQSIMSQLMMIQYSLKKGLNKSPQKDSVAVIKEMIQIQN